MLRTPSLLRLCFHQSSLFEWHHNIPSCPRSPYICRNIFRAPLSNSLKVCMKLQKNYLRFCTQSLKPNNKTWTTQREFTQPKKFILKTLRVFSLMTNLWSIILCKALEFVTFSNHSIRIYKIFFLDSNPTILVTNCMVKSKYLAPTKFRTNII